MDSQFDRVTKARHYNTHPCGVEAKHVVRLLDFNLGNVFKYVVRRLDNEHEDPVRGLRSAKFYLNDHRLHPGHCPAVRPEQLNQLLLMVLRYAEYEPDMVTKRFFLAFEQLLENPGSQDHHLVVDAALDQLIACTQLQNLSNTA